MKAPPPGRRELCRGIIQKPIADIFAADEASERLVGALQARSRRRFSEARGKSEAVAVAGRWHWGDHQGRSVRDAIVREPS